ncbi:MAG: hypothetical protein Kow0059_01310 [Candidatus Sumerlaeia bacterium]
MNQERRTFLIQPLIYGLGEHSQSPQTPYNDIVKNLVLTPNTYGDGIGVFGEYSGVGRPTAQIQENLIDANHTDGEGGGIGAVLARPTPTADTVQDNTITSNTAARGGGGIYLESCTLVPIHRNRIHNNVASALSSLSGGMHTWNSTPQLYCNNLTHNTAPATGTALAIDGAAAAGPPFMAIYNNTFAENIATGPDPATVDWWFATPMIDFTNNIFADNTGQIAVREPFGDSPQTFINNVFWNNPGGDVEDYALGLLTAAQVNAQPWGSGNLAADPMLDATYHIPPSSPARNAGINLALLGITWDIDNETRPKDAGFDIGADEVEIPLTVKDWRLH